MTQDLLTPRQLASETGWPERRIRSLLRTGELRHIRIGANYYLPLNAIEEFLSRKMVEPDTSDSGKK
ncbi:MAG: DNA-binding protein [Rhodobacterales bacterium]|nr:MAG: DNA-binding protein [Rhodobacterales bacterium]